MTVLENAMVGALLRHPRLPDARRESMKVLELVGWRTAPASGPPN